MKILMVLGNPGRGGSQSFVMNVLRFIDKEKYQVDVAFMSDRTDGYYDEIKLLGCKIFHLPRYKLVNKKVFADAWKKLFESNKYDIVHAHATGAAQIYLKIAKQFGCITISHSHSASYRGNIFERSLKRFYKHSVVKYSDYWFACSEVAGERLFGKKREDTSRYFLIPNMIDVDKFLYKEEVVNQIRKSLNLNNNTKIYGHLGSFSKPKNHIFLLNTFKEISKIEPNSVLLLVGEGPLKAKIVNEIDRLHLTNNVIMTGNVENSNEYLMTFDVMLFPSLFEGFPISVLEAQAAGVYSIISKTITNEVCLSEIVKYCDLRDSPKKWAELAINSPRVENRKAFNTIVANTHYNVRVGIKELQEIYSGIVR